MAAMRRATQALYETAAIRCGEVVGGNYLLDAVLGIGGMGIVYSAIQQSLGRPVAVKVPRPELAALPGLRARFRREAHVAGRLWHRNIISVIDYGDFEGVPYLVMERVHGLLLGRVVAEHGPFDVPIVVDIAAQVVDALAETHAAGFVHADVKSDNVLVEERREGRALARLFDFGLACDLRGGRTADRTVYGTPEYMAPEVIRGERPGAATDLYGMGIMLYELLTGITPFVAANGTDVLARHLGEDPLPPSRLRSDHSIPPALDDLVMRLLDKRPHARADDAATLAAELRATVPRLERSSRTTQVVPMGTASLPVIPMANGSDRQPIRSIDELRSATAAAINRSDENAIVDAYLALARALVNAHQPSNAAKELEIAIELLELRANAGRSVPSLWCVSVTLAAIYGHLGQTERARETAHAAHAHAGRVRSRIGQQRAEAVFARLVRGGTYARPTLR
jgi:serine/threonine protein kinase